MVRGPLTYDMVSLLKDCYIRWPRELVAELVALGYRTYSEAGLCSGLSEVEFSSMLALTGMQRHLKAAGIFCRLNHRDGKPGYLKDIPRTLFYVLETAREEPQLQDFARWLEVRVLPHFVYEPQSEALPCA
jgi:aminoglycoside/choline kinase family phosphotransferase